MTSIHEYIWHLAYARKIYKIAGAYDLIQVVELKYERIIRKQSKLLMI